MKTWQKVLGIVLIISILITSGYFIFLRRPAEEKANADAPPKIFDEELEDAILDASQAPAPERPPSEKVAVTETLKPLQKLLVAEAFSAMKFLADTTMQSQIMNAESLDQLVASKKEAEELLKLRDEVQLLLQKQDVASGGYAAGAQPAEMLAASFIPNAEEKEKLAQLKTKLDSLFTPGTAAANGKLDDAFKGTWTTPDRIVLRWTPVDGWVPENGYDLFRVLKGQAELLADGLGSAEQIDQLAGINAEFSEYIKPLFQAASLDADKKQILGVKTEKEFHDLVYKNSKSFANYVRISGELDFALYQEQLFSVSENIASKIPQSDAIQNFAVHFARDIQVPVQSINQMNMAPAEVQKTMQAQQQPALTEAQATIGNILDARKSILTKVFVDEQFAGEAGFGYEDDLTGKGLAAKEKVQYVLVPVEGSNENVTAAQLASGLQAEGSYSLTVEYGVETPVEIPAEFKGYGADNAAYLRWKAPVTEYARSVVSGYWIERRKKGETGFTRVNDAPVAISYTQDDNGILYETAAFFIDNGVVNGDEVEYRVQALDIFGRVSAFSETLPVKVYKVTPPVQPMLGEPKLSVTANVKRISKAVSQLFGINQNKPGVALPVTKTSDDVDSFVIYRSKAYGNGHFDMPEELIRINLKPFSQSTEPVYSKNGFESIFVIRPQGETPVDTIYYDNTVQPGYYYKYWAAATDSWGNESPWSESKIIGYPLETSPASPVNPVAEMKKNALVGGSSINPPGFFDRYDYNPFSLDVSTTNLPGTITKEDLAKAASIPDAGSNTLAKNTLQLGMGQSLSGILRKNSAEAPETVSAELNNLPKTNDVYEVIALSNEDLKQGGTASFTWPHFQGKGLAAYCIYSAYADGISEQALLNLTREEIVEAFSWKLVESSTLMNRVETTVEQKDNRLYLFMICLKAEIGSVPAEEYDAYLPAGWVRLSWERPEDRQLSYFRVYRAEVPYFAEGENTDQLNWTMVADHLNYAVYSEKVDQSFAHYYYYKVASVSVWGVESQQQPVTKIRIPATVAPSPPKMLVPFSRKEINEVNWMGVPHASKYIIYRYKLPKIKNIDIIEMHQLSPLLHDEMFNIQLYHDIYSSSKAAAPVDMVTAAASDSLPALKPGAATQQLKPTTDMTGRFKTIQGTDSKTFQARVSKVPTADKLGAFQTLADKYGILAVAPYSSLTRELAELVMWEKAGEVTIPLGEDSSGERTFYDSAVVFGETYLYTVQAVNDDNLASDRPEPVSVFTRKGKAFPPVQNVKGEIRENKAYIQWDTAKDPNMTLLESAEYVAGYLVYRSNAKDGEYYQASGLISPSETYFHDMNSNIYASNWYKVKVVDTAGFISDFSQAVNVTDSKGRTQPDAIFKKVLIGADAGFIPTDGWETTQNSLASAEKNAAFTLPNISRPSLATPTPSPAVSPGRVTRPGQEPIIAPQVTVAAAPTPVLDKLLKPTTIPEIRVTVAPTPTASPTSAPRATPTTAPTQAPPKVEVKTTPVPTAKPTLAPPKLETKATPTPPAGTPTPPVKGATPTPAVRPPMDTDIKIPDLKTIQETMVINGFQVTDLSLAGKVTGTGEGMLHLRSFAVPCQVTINSFKADTITDGAVSMKDKTVLGDTGIHLLALNIKTGKPDATASGYVSNPSGNLLGDMDVLNFNDSRLSADGIIHIYNIPSFHYQNLTFYHTGKISVNFGSLGANLRQNPMTLPVGGDLEPLFGNGFINLHIGTAESSLGLESTNNKGLRYSYTMVSFNGQGQLTGTLELKETQFMHLVVPAGLAIKAMDSVLTYSEGKVDASKSHITGRILTPFKTFEDVLPTDTQESASKRVMDAKTFAALSGKAGSISGNTQTLNVLHQSLYYIAQRAQIDALLVFPDDPAAQETLSHAPFHIQAWDGGGFMVDDGTMTPSNIPLYDPNKLSEEQLESQKEANLGITPGKIALDLRRDAAYGGSAPVDAKEPGWMGIVVKNGSVSLPPAYIQTTKKERIRFNLTPGELLYDQNGFSYQNQAYTPEGAPAVFGAKLGDFKDVLVRNVVIDLYNNIADLQIDADLAIPILHRRVRVKMLRDDDSGMFVCNVAETEKFDPAGNGKVKLRITGGYLDEVGMHIDGTMDLQFGENADEMNLTDAQFTDLILPSSMANLHKNQNPGIYGTALFDKPYLVEFNQFPMEVRAFKLASVIIPMSEVTFADYTGPRYTTNMNLWGGMQLSDNLALNTSKDADTIRLNDIFYAPAFSYEESHSEVVMNFEEFAEITGTGKPIATSGGYIEYDTSNFKMAFTSAGSLLPDGGFDINARIGYDRNKERSYFAVAMAYTGPGIPFSIGEIRDMSAMLGYNMDMAMNPDGTYAIPDGKAALLGMVDTMPVNSGSGNYFFAAACTMQIGFGGISLGEIRDIYLVVEKGPTLEMAGAYYGPDSVDDFGGSGGLKKMGDASIGYYHRQKLFKFSISLHEFGMYGLTVSGDMGFEMSPDYWEFRMGYPKMLMTRAGPYNVGFGLAIRDSDIDESYIRAKAQFGFDAQGDIGIVYVRAFLMAGGEGMYTANNLWLSVYLRGGVEGGVRAMGKNFKVISLMLEANGDLKKGTGGDWSLDANARISYHVDLWLDDISGSVNWHIHTSF